MKIMNFTPHPIKVGEREFLPSGIIPRVGVVETPSVDVDGIPTVTVTYTAVEGLPEPQDGVFYLVSRLVFDAAPERADLLAPDTGKTAIRDESGRIIAVTRLIRRG